MSSNELGGDALVSEANKKMAEAGLPSFLGNKNDRTREVADLYEKAANMYKLDKKCTIDMTRFCACSLHESHFLDMHHYIATCLSNFANQLSSFPKLHMGWQNRVKGRQCILEGCRASLAD